MSLTKIRKSNIESNVQLPHANAAFDTANSSGVYANAAFTAANNAAAGSVDSYARDTANSAYSEANNKLSLSGGTLTGNLVVGGNVIPTTDNTYFLGSETVRWHSLYVGDGSIYIGDLVLSNDANRLAVTDSDGNKVTISSNNIVLGDFVLSSSGAITGDVIITGNLKVTGTTAELEVSGLIVDDNIIDINEATLGAPTLNAGLRVKRGDENPVLLRWNETNDRWEYTNDGTNYSNIASAAAETYANAAYALSNTKYSASGGLIDGDVSISGNLIVTGNTVYHSANDFIVADPIVLFANNNPGNLLDIGFVGHYVEDTTTKHTGLIKDVSGAKWYLFDNYEPHVQETNILDVSDASFRVANLTANIVTDVLTVRNYDVLSHTNLSFDVANAASSYANSAFLRANTPSDTANSAGVYANAGYDQANTATTNAAQADQRAVTSGDYANSGYSLANTANTLAQAAFDAANTGSSGTDDYARDTANSAGVYANAAFAVANTGGSSSNSFYVNIVHDSFVASGSQDTFTLSTTPINENYTLVTINGIVQHKNAYSVSSANLVLSESPAANSEIDVVSYTRLGAGLFNLSILLDTFSGDGTTNTFSLSTSPVNENYTSVVIDGVAQLKTSYNVSGSDLIFAESPDSGANIDVTIYTSAATEENIKVDLAYDHANAAYEQANTGGGGASAARAMTMAILFG